MKLKTFIQLNQMIGLETETIIRMPSDELLIQTCRRKEHKILERKVSQHSKFFKMRLTMESEPEIPYDAMAYGCLVIFFGFIVLITLVDYYFD